MIYIPTLTSKLRIGLDKQYENILYSPNVNLDKVYKGSNITIWDNYTFYLRSRYHKPDKHIKARNHYLWLIDFIKNNYEEGITLITPDVEWLKDRELIEEQWNKECSIYPQLYVPETWKTPTDKLNIIGYALRINTPEKYIHENWNHCLKHKRELNSKLLTYDSTIEIKEKEKWKSY